ncbi:MAG: GntR family transcriptional regulator [Chloroflexi bacterium]|nr:GntR family transcriptional regulator [Chloroflexota bacterium]
MQPLRPDRAPLHVQAQNRLRVLIEQGRFGPGEQLPAEVQLAAQFGISRPTLREALLHLEREGIVVRRHGVGTFVALDYHQRMDSGLERMESILEVAERQGIAVDVVDLEVFIEPATKALMAELQVERDTPITWVRRVLLVDGMRAAYMVDAAPESILGPGDLNGSFAGSVVDLLRQKSGASAIGQAVAHIAAVNADETLAERLRVERGQALLLLEETLFDEAGAAIDYSHNYFIPNRFRFHVIRR